MESPQGHPTLERLMVAIGFIGAILLIFGLIISAFAFSVGINLACFGLIITISTIIIYVLATDGIDTDRTASRV